MSDIRFYQLSGTGLDAALSGLLEKALSRGMRAVVAAGSEEGAERISGMLWTAEPAGFLPHGTAKDGTPALQPVFIGPGEDNPNGAKLLVVLDGFAPSAPDAFEMCCIMFDGADESALRRAREAWKALKEGGHALSYWQQDADGRWQKTA